MDEKKRFKASALVDFATANLVFAGLMLKKAIVVAETLVEADLMGHSTHGLFLLQSYLDELTTGKMASVGEPVVMQDRQASFTWNGCYLPGPWLVHKAMKVAFDRILQHPVVTIVIQKSHHIGCLATYPKFATDKGLVMLLSCSDPNSKTVAPFGGKQGVYSPNPIAAGFPTGGDPIIIDVSMSATSNGLVSLTRQEGNILQHKWLIDNEGKPTHDPAALKSSPPGALLPLGGMDSGYKGFALGIMVEALTSALGGYGRANNPGRWGASVFMQLIDPNAFAGIEAFKNEMDFLKIACLDSTSIDHEKKVRLPGSRSLELRNQQTQSGIVLNDTIVNSLSKISAHSHIKFPQTF